MEILFEKNSLMNHSYFSFLSLFRHHFKLDKQYIKGSDISLHLIAAFASINENDVNELQILLRQMLRGNKTSISNRNGPLSDTQSTFSSNFIFHISSQTVSIFLSFCPTKTLLFLCCVVFLFLFFICLNCMKIKRCLFKRICLF